MLFWLPSAPWIGWGSQSHWGTWWDSWHGSSAYSLKVCPINPAPSNWLHGLKRTTQAYTETSFKWLQHEYHSASTDTYNNENNQNDIQFIFAHLMCRELQWKITVLGICSSCLIVFHNFIIKYSYCVKHTEIMVFSKNISLSLLLWFSIIHCLWNWHLVKWCW